MAIMIRVFVLCIIDGISCNVFFGTMLIRKWHPKDSAFLALAGEILPSLVFAAGFIVISVTEAPGYLLQPIRVLLVLSLIIRIFYWAKLRKIILLTVFWCAIYWTLNLLAVSLMYALPWRFKEQQGLSDVICSLLLLCLSLFFRCKCKDWSESWEGTGYGRFAWLPVLSLIVTTLMSITVWFSDSLNKSGVVIIAAGYSVINVLGFYFIGTIVEKDAKLQRAEVIKARLNNQMELVENLQANDMRYRRCLHDYKNQLGCIQGLLEAGEITDALGYIKELSGSIKKGGDHVNTNHPVVNTVLNQKYLRAQEKGITLIMAVNDLSELMLCREDIVTLLVNLLDNAIEACEKLDENRIIQFKMMLEEGELTISVRNPLKEPVVIMGKRLQTTKEKKDNHGLGMLNINSVIEKNQGTSILECQDGWFYFSAVIPEV